MWVTLVTHSLQVLAIALVVGGRLGKLSKSRAALGLLLGAIIDLVGYGLGRAFYLWNTSSCYYENSF